MTLEMVGTAGDIGHGRQDVIDLVLADLARRRARGLPSSFTADEVASAVAAEFARFSEARVQNFVPLLVRRAVVQNFSRPIRAAAR